MGDGKCVNFHRIDSCRDGFHPLRLCQLATVSRTPSEARNLSSTIFVLCVQQY